MTVDMFEAATREKLRWNYRGLMSAENLWDLMPIDLDAIYRALSAEIRDSEGVDSLISQESNKKLSELILKRDIVKHIYMVKKAEADNAVADLERRQQAEKIRAAIQRKKDGAIEEMSLEELEKQLQAVS